MKKIDYIVPETGVKLTIPSFEVKTMEDIYDKWERDIYNSIVKCLTRMSETELDSLACFAITVQGVESIFNLDRNRAQEQVENCIEYYESIEEYETCALIKNLKLQFNT